MGYYDNILKLLSLALIFAILFIVIYGCQFKKYRYVEGFTNDDTPPQEEAEEPKKTLEGFEGRILEGLNDGSITNKEMEKFIENGTFTKKNLENIIEYIDNFKDHLRL